MKINQDNGRSGNKIPSGSDVTNLHTLLDRLGAAVGGLVYRNHRFFSRCLESVSLREAVPQTKAPVTKLKTSGWQTVIAEGPAGTFETAYRVVQWTGDRAPVLLYIHGSGENPRAFNRKADNSFYKMFGKNPVPGMNTILLMAPFHEEGQGPYIRALGDMTNYVGMLASVTALLDSLSSLLRRQGSPAIYAAGFSLGGWALNLHRAFLGRGIDRYVPICAGAQISPIFTDSPYRVMIDPDARRQCGTLRKLLDFEEAFTANQSDNCHPMLFRYDQLVRLGDQAGAYRHMDLNITEKGHFTGQSDTEAMRRHILASIGNPPLLP